MFARTWALCLTKFEIFKLTQYEKLVYLDADILVMKNLDHLFEYPHLTSALDGEYHNIWPNDPHFNAGILVIEPNNEEYNKLVEFSNSVLSQWERPQCIADQEILNLYYKDWIDKKELHLDKYYDIFAPYVQEDELEDICENCYFIHFVGRKPWRAFFKNDEETYSEYFYELARKYITETINTLNWDRAKDQIKIAIYGICKNEIVNIKKYIQCFSKADYLCILDTGSTDGTWEYIQSAQKEYPNLIIEQKIFDPWRYDDARNHSLTLVPKDTTMYFMMDLDELIHTDDWTHQMRTYWDPMFRRGEYIYNRSIDKDTGAITQQFHEYRIHNNEWHYEGIIHEQFYDITGNRSFMADECIEVPITVWHYATHPNREEYIELCEQGVKEQPLNWLMHLQLAAEYEVHEMYDKAIDEYRKIIAEQTTLCDAELGRCYASLGRCLYFSDKPDEGLNALYKGLEQIKDCGDIYYFAAEINYSKGNFAETYRLCEQGIDKCKVNQWCTIIGYDTYFPYMLMALAQFYLNNKILALGYITLAKERNNNEDISHIYDLILNDINNRG